MSEAEHIMSVYCFSFNILKNTYDIESKNNYVCIQKENVQYAITHDEPTLNIIIQILKYKGIYVSSAYISNKHVDYIISIQNNQYYFECIDHGILLCNYVLYVDHYLLEIHKNQCKNLIANMRYLLNNNIIMPDIYNYMKTLAINM